MSAGVWQEAAGPDGRPYYWNTVTKETRWEKPEEVAVAVDPTDQPWKEYTHTDGRKYYHNPQTNATVWDMPEAFRRAQAQAPSQAAPAQQQAPQQNFVAGGGPQQQQRSYRDREDRDRGDRGDRGDDRRDFGRDREDRRDYGRGDRSDNVRSTFVPATTNEPEYRSFEEAEGAFMTLLKKSGAQLDWTWDDAMRATMRDPQYRALKDPKERRGAFEKYLLEQRAQNKEREKERTEKLRQDFTTMLQSHPDIKHNTRWKTARPIIEGETIFKSAGNDTERRQLFDEYIHGLRKQHVESQAADRRAAVRELGSVLRSLDLDPDTHWDEARESLDMNEKFQSDAKFKTLTKSDVLTGYENHMKALERTMNEQKQQERMQKGRHERQYRDGFLELLRELQSSDKIKAGTKWMQVRPLIEDDERFEAVLGLEGSTPLDLFLDIVEEEERNLRAKRNDVLDVLDASQFEITTATTIDEYMAVVQGDPRTDALHEDDLKLIFERLHEKIVRRQEEDKYHAERSQRRAIDALRSRIKHLDPPVRLEDSWADVRPRLEKLSEYSALESDDLRQQAYDKVIRRLKEKEADIEADRARRAERRRPDTNGHRRDRDGHSRTPEVDAYEADRRKAMAARESKHRKSENIGLSPDSPRRRERHERYDDRDRYEHGRLAPTRERYRDYDDDRTYTSRDDPRHRSAKDTSGLDYGDGRADSASGASSRRRRRSDVDEDEHYEDSKRRRRDRASRTPAADVKMKEEEKEEEALKSGSEEGEIEEA